MKSLPLLLLVGMLRAPSGCQPEPTPTPLPVPSPADGGVGADMALPANPYGMPTCPLTMTVTLAGSCDPNFITTGPGQGLSCFHCTGASGCYDSVDSVYCATGPAGCTSDKLCVPVNDGADDGNGYSAKRKAKKPLKKIPNKVKKS